MKRIFCAVISLISISTFAQNKSVEFTKKLSYRLEALTADSAEQEELSKIVYDYYVGKNNQEGLLSFSYNDSTLMSGSYGGETNYFVKENWLIPIAVSGISKAISYTSYGASALINDKKVVAKLDRKGTFNGINCQYYAVFASPSDKENPEFCFCIDETNKINNAEAIFPAAKAKGMILAVESNENDYRLVYKSSENSTLELALDGDQMIAEVKQSKKEQEALYDELPAAAETYDFNNYSNDIYQDPLFGYGDAAFDNYEMYNYLNQVYGITSTLLYNSKEYNNEGGTTSRAQVLKLYKSLSKNLVKGLSSSHIITKEEKKQLNDHFKTRIKEAKQFVPGTLEETIPVDYAYADAEEVAFEAYDFYTNYESTYRNGSATEVSLAYDLADNDIKNNAPKYCEDLKNNIPDFQSTDLKHHVYNLIGQICDLYLYNNGGNVDQVLTINEMRRSLLEIEKLRSLLSQKDQKSLLEFLKSLD